MLAFCNGACRSHTSRTRKYDFPFDAGAMDKDNGDEIETISANSVSAVTVIILITTSYRNSLTYVNFKLPL